MKQDTQKEQETIRGLVNPKVVDLIYPREGADEVVLQMVETRPWSQQIEQAEQLEEKFNNYLDYVLDGWFARQYPTYSGKKVRLELKYVSQPPEKISAMLEEMKRYADSIGLGFECRLEEDLAEQMNIKKKL